MDATVFIFALISVDPSALKYQIWMLLVGFLTTCVLITRNQVLLPIQKWIIKNDSDQFLPYHSKWEIPGNEIRLYENSLAQGSFGIVFKGQIFSTRKVVAIKMIKSNQSQSRFEAFIYELRIMANLGNHANVVNLVGACSEKFLQNEIIVLMEYCEFGNILEYIKRNSNNFINQINSDTGKYTAVINKRYHRLHRISTQRLVCWAHEIACGLEYLACRKILHNDLAARNTLLHHDDTVKIGDFGLSIMLNPDEDYRFIKCPVAIRWMPIETISHRIFSTQSDVWSFGVVLWELFSLATQRPYNEFDDQHFIFFLRNGYRMDQPSYAPNEIYEIMEKCWEEDRMCRPTPTDLVEKLASIRDDANKLGQR